MLSEESRQDEMMVMTPPARSTVEKSGKAELAFEMTHAAVLRHGGEFGEGGGEIGPLRGGIFAGFHESFPHLLGNFAAGGAELAAGHRRPFVLNHGLRVDAGVELQLRASGFGKTFGEAIKIDEGVGFLVGIHVGGAEIVPDVIEHETENDGVGGADDAHLPADDFVVAAAAGGGPHEIDDDEGRHAEADPDDEDDGGAEDA